MSEHIKKLILGLAKHWQVHLIYYLYSQKQKDQSYLYFYPTISDEVLKQVSCVKPDPSKKSGNAPENWEAENSGVHDVFDVLKMAYLAIDFAVSTMQRTRWRFCKSPALQRRWEKSLKRDEQEKQSIDVDKFLEENEPEKPSWFK